MQRRNFLPTPITPLDEGKSEWRSRLPDDACQVLFNASNERAGSCPLDEKFREGLYVFNEGPVPVNERWCNGGVALRCIARKGATVA